MADPAKRQIAFNVVERNCCARFAEGEEGIKLYFQLLADVQRGRSLIRQSIEFEKRFMPMLDQVLAEREGLSRRRSGRSAPLIALVWSWRVG